MMNSMCAVTMPLAFNDNGHYWLIWLSHTNQIIYIYDLLYVLTLAPYTLQFEIE